jgi:hypothetical protein
MVELIQYLRFKKSSAYFDNHIIYAVTIKLVELVTMRRKRVGQVFQILIELISFKYNCNYVSIQC